MDTCACAYLCIHIRFSSVQISTVWFFRFEHLNEVRYLACFSVSFSKVLVNALDVRCVYLTVALFSHSKTWIESVARTANIFTNTQSTIYWDKRGKKSNEIYKHAHLIRCNKSASTIIIRPSSCCFFFCCYSHLSIQCWNKSFLRCF